MEVYKFIQNLDVKFHAIVRRKQSLVEDVKIQNKWLSDWKYNQNDVYDGCIKMLFKDRLHIAKSNHITFASRGKTSRNEALKQALSSKNDQKVENEFFVISNNPSGETCLQIIDYGLWALQRLYEKGEERYFNFLRDKFERIIDLDDKRNNKPYGVYYDKKNNLTAEKIKNPLES